MAPAKSESLFCHQRENGCCHCCSNSCLVLCACWGPCYEQGWEMNGASLRLYLQRCRYESAPAAWGEEGAGVSAVLMTGAGEGAPSHF